MPNFKRIIVLGISGFAGIFAAIIADMAQKNEASAIINIGDIFRENIHPSITNLIIILVLFFLGELILFVFEPDTKKKAFYTGASLLTIIMTLIPYKSVDTASSRTNTPARETTSLQKNKIEDISFKKIEYLDLLTNIAQENLPDLNQRNSVKINLQTETNQQINEASIIILDSNTGKKIGRVQTSQNNFNLYLEPGEYMIINQVNGYKIEERTIEVTNDNQPERLNIELEKTWIPIPIQRSFKNY